MAFHEVAGETHKKLQTLWDEIGTSQEERTEHMRRLTQDLTHLFHSALKNEQVRSIDRCILSLASYVVSQVARDLLMQSILRMLDDMLSICASLGEELEMVRL